MGIVSHKTKRITLLLLMSIVLLFTLPACNLGTTPETEAPIPTEEGSDTVTDVPDSVKPSVTIVSPADGDEFVVDEPILVSVNAVDSVGVTRLQLFANGSIVKTVSSESIAGDQTLTAVLDYTPRATGTVNMQVLAFRGSVASDPGTLQVTVRGSSNQVQTTTQPNPSVPQIPNDGVCRALTNVNLNYRSQPTTEVDNVITVLPTGTLAPILARLGDNSWWKIQYGTNVGWVSADFTTEYGNCLNVPVETFNTPTPNVTETSAPTLTPLPTDTPAATLTPALPDLIITSITGEETLALGNDGEVISEYAVTIANVGLGASASFEVALDVILGTETTTLDAGVVSELGSGQSITLLVEVTFESDGDYVLRAEADMAEVVEEVSEINNRGDIDVVVEPAS
jgi:hypothetical protein